MGLLFFAVGFAYLALVGVRLVPPRRPLEELTAGYGVHAYLAEVRVPEGSELIGRTLVEAVVAPDSSLPGKSLAEVDFAQRFGAAVLGLRHRGEARVDRLADVTLRGGDSLLLTTRSGDERELERDGAF